MRSDVRTDYAVLEGSTFSRVNNRGFQALCLYRIAHRAWMRGIPLLPMVCTRVAQILYGIDIDHRARIGPGARIFHGVGLVIGPRAIVGRNVILYHGVTIGAPDHRKATTLPHLGDDVFVGAGAKILGPIDIGDGVRIGANAVVLRDVPAGAVAVGVPARILAERAAPGVVANG